MRYSFWTRATSLVIMAVAAVVIYPTLLTFVQPFAGFSVETLSILSAIILMLASVAQIDLEKKSQMLGSVKGLTNANRTVASLHEIDSVVFLATLAGFLYTANAGAHPPLAQAFFSATLSFGMAILIYFFNNDAVLGHQAGSKAEKLSRAVQTMSNGLVSAALVFAFGFFFLGILYSALPALQAPLFLITALVLIPVVLDGLHTLYVLFVPRAR